MVHSKGAFMHHWMVPMVATNVKSGCRSYSRGRGKENHDFNSLINYHDNRVFLESYNTVIIFSRSELLKFVWYVNFLGDEDSNTYGAACENKPYGQIQNALDT